MAREHKHMLDAAEQALLLRIAHDSLKAWLISRTPPDLAQYPLTPRLEQKAGAFVTLHHGSKLRGCIGYTRGVESLASAVAENVVNAGFRDPRFDPIIESEYDTLDIEISVLLPGETEGSPFVAVQDISEIVIGRDGLYLEHAGGHGGLLLPQVPVEQGWNLDQYLRGICSKAGLSPDAWRGREVRLYRFEAQVFGTRSKLQQ